MQTRTVGTACFSTIESQHPWQQVVALQQWLERHSVAVQQRVARRVVASVSQLFQHKQTISSQQRQNQIK